MPPASAWAVRLWGCAWALTPSVEAPQFARATTRGGTIYTFYGRIRYLSFYMEIVCAPVALRALPRYEDFLRIPYNSEHIRDEVRAPGTLSLPLATFSASH